MRSDPTKKPEKFKHKLFMMLSLLIEQNTVNIALYGLVILLEYYGLLHYAFLSHYMQYSTSDVSAGAYKAFYLFNYIYSLSPNNLLVASIVCIIVLSIVIVVFCVLLIITKGKKMREKYSVISKSVYKAYGIVQLVVGIGLFYPIAYLIGKSFDCMSSTVNVVEFYNVNLPFVCWESSRIVLSGISGFVIAVFLVVYLYLTIMFNDDRPNSTLPWGGKLSFIPIIKLILKIGIVVLLLVDKNMVAKQWSNLCITIIYLLIMFLRFKEPQMRYKIAQYFLMFEEANLFCIYGITTLNMAIEGSEHLLYVILCMCPIIFIAYLYILEWRHSSIITSTLPGFLKSLNDVEYYIDTLIGYLKNTQDNHNYIILTGILITHAKFCEKQDCVCQRLQEIVNDRSMVKLSSGENKSFYTKNANYHIQYCMKQYEAMFAKNQDKWKQFIKVLLEEAVANYSKLPRVYIYKSYIEFFLMKNVFMSLYELSNSENFKPALRDQFNIFYQAKIIEDQIMHARKSSIPEISKAIKYLKYYNLFIEEVELCSSNHSQFWTSLLASQPDPKKLNLLGKEISLNMKKISKIYKKIAKLNEQSITFIFKYALFLKIIMQDDTGSSQLINKMDQMNPQNLIHDETESDTLRGERIVIRASGDKNSLNKIIDINFEAEQALKYSKKDIVGLSGNILMLPNLSENHDVWMRNYYSNLVEKYLNKVCIVELKTKNGNYISCNGLCKMVPNLDNGIEFIQFLTIATQFSCIPASINKVNKRPALFIFDSNNKIIGINSECKEYFLLPYSISDSINTENLIDKIIPELSPKINGRENMIKRDGSFLQISAQRLIAMAIELYQNDEREAANKDYNISQLRKQKKFIVWVKLVEEENGEGENQTKTSKLFVIPLTEEEEKALISKEDAEKMETSKNDAIESYDSSNEEDEQKQFIEERKGSVKQGFKKLKVKNKLKDKNENVSAMGGSQGSSINSDSKNVREMKLMLNEKGVPHSVIVLRNLIIFLLIILAILSVVDYIVNKLRVDQIDINFNRIQTVATRFSQVSFATFLTRAYTDIIVGVESLDISKYSEQIIANRKDLLVQHMGDLVELIKDNQNYLESIQIDLPQEAYDAERKILNLIEYNDKLENSTNKQPLNVGIMQFINKIIYLISLNITGINNSDYLTMFVNKSLSIENLSELLRVTEFVVENGINSLRNATQQSDQIFLDKFLDKAQLQRNLLLGLLLSAIVLTLVCYVFVLPNIIRVAKQKASVTAIFSDIPNKDIEAMLNKSQQISIKEASVDVDLLQDMPEEETKDGEEKKADSPTPNADITKDANKDKADTTLKDTTQKDATVEGILSPEELEEQKKKAEEELKATKKREYLEKSDNSLKRQSLLKITIIVSLYLAYFIFNLVFTYSVYSDFDDASDNLITISKREPFLIMQALLVREAVYERTSEFLDGKNSMPYSEYYKESLLIEDDLLLFQKVGSNIFSSYRYMSSKMDDSDSLCTLLQPNVTSAIASQCESIDSKSLGKGLRNSIFRYMSFISKLERDFESNLLNTKVDNTTYTRSSWDYLNNQDVLLSMHILIEYIEPALRILFTEYMSNARSYFQLYNLICLIKSIGFVLILVISYFCIFNTFLNQLKSEIWETNGMLNMIPTKFLLQSKSLKEKFLSHQV